MGWNSQLVHHHSSAAEDQDLGPCSQRLQVWNCVYCILIYVKAGHSAGVNACTFIEVSDHRHANACFCYIQDECDLSIFLTVLFSKLNLQFEVQYCFNICSEVPKYQDYTFFENIVIQWNFNLWWNCEKYIISLNVNTQRQSEKYYAQQLGFLCCYFSFSCLFFSFFYWFYNIKHTGQ